MSNYHVDREQRFSALRTQISNIEHQIATEKLLEEVWIELGPTSTLISKDLLNKLNKYFKYTEGKISQYR